MEYSGCPSSSIHLPLENRQGDVLHYRCHGVSRTHPWRSLGIFLPLEVHPIPYFPFGPQKTIYSTVLISSERDMREYVHTMLAELGGH